jgi:hypothetical protein
MADTEQQAREKRVKAQQLADEKNITGARSYVDELEKYHIAGQGYMAAPKPPIEQQPEGEPGVEPLHPGIITGIMERIARTDKDIVRQQLARMAPEEAVKLAHRERLRAGKEEPATGGGLYYAVPAAQEKEDDPDEPTHQPTKPAPPPPPPPTTPPA